MGQKDIVEKMLEDYNDVFADIVNVLLFQGKCYVNENNLTEANGRSQYKADSGKLHEQERDVVKYWQDGNVNIAICGLENQTAPEKYMPLRVFNYDAASYRQQLNKDQDGNVVPVITLVLYFGTEDWKYPSNLKGIIDIPDILEPYVSDYSINVFKIAFLEDETVRSFKSDFRIIADFFVQKRKNADYKGSRENFKHVDEFLKFMNVFTGDSRYDITFSDEEKERGICMCDVMEKAEAKGIEIGIKNGIHSSVSLLRKSGINDECIEKMIMEEYHLTIEEVKEYV